MELDDDACVCDIGSCFHTAVFVVPGAYICRDCLTTYTIETESGPRYRIPVERLAVSFAGRERRRRDYQIRLDQLRATDGGIARDGRDDDMLDELIRVAVEDFIASTGALP